MVLNLVRARLIISIRHGSVGLTKKKKPSWLRFRFLNADRVTSQIISNYLLLCAHMGCGFEEGLKITSSTFWTISAQSGRWRERFTKELGKKQKWSIEANRGMKLEADFFFVTVKSYASSWDQGLEEVNHLRRKTWRLKVTIEVYNDVTDSLLKFNGRSFIKTFFE